MCLDRSLFFLPCQKLSIKKDVIDFIDTRMEAFNFCKQMSDDEPSKATYYSEAGKVEREEIGLCHFLGLAYPKTPATIEPRIAR